MTKRDTASGFRQRCAFLAVALALAGALPAAADTILGTPGATIIMNEGAIGTNLLVATFVTDNPNLTAADFNAVVNWGDGNSTPATISASGGGPGFNVIASSYAYAEEGTFTPSVNITSDDSGSFTVADEADIADAPLSNGSLALGTLTEGTAFSGTLGSFTDGYLGATPSDFNADIEWGDGSSSIATFTGSGGSFNVSGGHTYAEAGSYPVLIVVHDIGGSDVTITGPSTVLDAPLSGSGLALAGTAGSPVSGAVANLNDGNSLAQPNDFSATIDWGDGSQTAGTVTGNGGVFQILGTHTYLSGGLFTTSIQANDLEGSTDTFAGSVDVASISAAAPEPAAWFLAVAGIALLAWRRKVVA